MCIIGHVQLEAVEEACYCTLGVPFLNPVPIPPRQCAMSNLGENGLCIFVQTHVLGIHQWTASCRFYTFKYPMDDVTILRGFQFEVLVAQSGNAMGWVRAICYSKCNRVVKVNNPFVLDVPKLGAIIDVMHAILAGLSD